MTTPTNDRREVLAAVLAVLGDYLGTTIGPTLQREMAERITRAALAAQEGERDMVACEDHVWTPCAGCPRPDKPCACSGGPGPCCPVRTAQEGERGGAEGHNAGITSDALRYAATHEALCRSWIFDLLTGLADTIEAQS